MIKPDNVRPRSAPSPRIERQMKALESACDDAIRRADARGTWPARVGRMRMQIDREAVDRVALAYRLAGWRVDGLGLSDCYMEIDRP